MSVDTSGLFGWPSPDAIDAARVDIGRGARAYLDQVRQDAATWQQLGVHYSGEGQDEVLAGLDTSVARAEFLAALAAQAEAALTDFAGGIRSLEARRRDLLARIEQAEARAAEAAAADDALPVGTAASDEWMLAAEAAAMEQSYLSLEAETAARLAGVPDGGGDFLNWAAGAGGTVTTALMGAGLDAVKSHRVTARHYVRYPTRESRERHMARGRWENIPGGRAVTRWDFRPDISSDLYNLSNRYKAWVDANPARWSPQAGGFGDLSAGARTARVGGGLLTLATAGLTIRDEREDAYNELLAANPSMSAAELNERANVEGAVKGGTKVVFDAGTAMAGAAIGTAIGGPVGAAAGLVIGIGISIATDHEFDFLGGRSIKDAAADTVMDAADAVTESVRGAVEEVAGLWNDLWG